MIIFRTVSGLILLLLVTTACASPSPARVVNLDPPVAPPTRIVIYVTPTTVPTGIPTVDLRTTTPIPSPTPEPSHTPDPQQMAQLCRTQTELLYEQASELCLGKPAGFICNGGTPPDIMPAGAVSNALAVPGALVELPVVERVQTAPVQGNRGGLLWMRFDDSQAQDALLIGDVQIENTASAEQQAWESFTVQTTTHESECASNPPSALVMQAQYGRTGRFIINGTTVEVNGTLVIQTEAASTAFIALEGSSRITAGGIARVIFAGQQVNVPYLDGNFARPSGTIGQTMPLRWESIEHLPIMLFDRPVLLPQPGYIYTEGRVNMRAEPDVDSQRLYQVPPDETLSILGVNRTGAAVEDTWYHVRLGNGETGWMRADLLRGQVGDIQQVYVQTPQPPVRYGEGGDEAIVNAQQGGNLREAPDTFFPVIETLAEGTEVQLLARSPYSSWVKVDVNGTEGWMAMLTLETQSVFGFLPIDYSAPLPPRPTATPVYAFGGGHAYPDFSGGN